MSEDILLSQLQECGVALALGVEVRDAANILQCTEQHPRTKDCPAPAITHVKIKKLCLIGQICFCLRVSVLQVPCV